ncbi:MAG: hypothetical protein G01um101448_445 [Parcubacteria group bacterium Gr01-1014_48]|nr:MAG: hypothetical protein Greene041614_266 [Parcubacteria group bacterium Greene0416_14]TSC73897.1 MAG: hypothetical protein G01um101448_445 [Parcubacteria group bacterium Gr01-1014_48]TSC99866.1 MAG: hypothetical protein Greene101415_1054 [Parcubacteria group bacterium Greene1014_15]TSD06689.1 MAG: hypothetical protein Greene07144_1129 [Parcubacteria group bacterium Greene0714_4]
MGTESYGEKKQKSEDETANNVGQSAVEKKASLDVTASLDEKEESFSGFKKKSEEEYAEYQEEAQKMIDGYKHLFATFAGDISLQSVWETMEIGNNGDDVKQWG